LGYHYPVVFDGLGSNLYHTMTTPFTLHLAQQRDKKMSGEIKFKGHPCLTFTGKSWIQLPFYKNMVAILNVSQQKEVNETP
jgi:hypothetical protein